MAIVALFFLNSRGDSIPVKKPWWLLFLLNSRGGFWLIGVKAVILLEALVALFLFNDHRTLSLLKSCGGFFPVKEPWWLQSC
jgi:hypothetical protein